MDVVSFIIGLCIGVISVGLAIELGMKRTPKTQGSTRPTHKWSISEIANPRIVAEYLGDMDLPKNAKIVVNQYENKDRLLGLEAREHAGIRGNYILGDDRALILAGPVKSDELGIWTVEKEMLEKLSKYFEDSWVKAHEFSADE